MATTPQEQLDLPSDNLNRALTLARPDADQNLRHIGLVGDTYTIIVSGEATAGRFCLIDMHIPPGGGPRSTVMISKRHLSSSKARWKRSSGGRRAL